MRTARDILTDLSSRLLSSPRDRAFVPEPILFVVDGGTGGKFLLDTGRAPGFFETGEDARNRVRLSRDDLEAIAAGSANPLALYRSGRLVVEGSRRAALSLTHFWRILD